MTIERAQQIAAAIAEQYVVFECDECAKEIAQRLGKSFNASFELLRTADNSERIGLEAEEILISTNRFHLGIRIGDLIFDNLHHKGLPADEWPSRFVTATGATLERQSKPLSDFFGKIFLVEKFRRWLADL